MWLVVIMLDTAGLIIVFNSFKICHVLKLYKPNFQGVNDKIPSINNVLSPKQNINKYLTLKKVKWPKLTTKLIMAMATMQDCNEDAGKLLYMELLDTYGNS